MDEQMDFITEMKMSKQWETIMGNTMENKWEIEFGF